MPEDLDPARLRKLTLQMVEAITSPAFVEAMRAVRSAPTDKRLDEAKKRLTPAALRAQGVPLPADMRISSRYFEQGKDPVEVGDLTREGSSGRSAEGSGEDAGVWACSCAGALEVCGGAGGGS